MSAAEHSDDWAAHLKAVNLAFAGREWQLTEALKAIQREHDAAKERLTLVEQQAVDADGTLVQLRSQVANHEAAAVKLNARIEAMRQAQHESERALLERIRRVNEDAEQRQRVALDANASLLETLVVRERNHAEQLENLVRRLANAEMQLAAVSAAGETKAAASAELQVELAQARVALAGAQDKVNHQAQLLAGAQAEITSQQQALSLLSAEHTRMNGALRATLDAYARQVQVLQSEQVRLKGLLVMRLSERVHRLFGRPTRAVDASQPYVDGMPATGPFAGTDVTSAPPEPHPPAFNSERTVAPTPKTTITHVHQLMALRGHAFVDSAYASLLNRRPDAGGLEYYLTRLRTDHDKVQILIELATSDEGRARNKSLVGLQELIVARDTRAQRLRRWLLRRPGQDQTLARIEANVGALGDEFDVRLQAMDQRLSQLSRTLDGVVTLLSAKIEAVGNSVEVASSLMAGDPEAVAKARLALFESQSLVAQTLQTDRSSAGSGAAAAVAGLSPAANAAPTTDALSCYLTAEAGSTSLMDSLSRHLATTTQAKTLSTS